MIIKRLNKRGLMSDELIDLKEKISSISDSELLKIVNIDFADYREEVMDFAREELRKRNISEEDIEEEIEDHKESDLRISIRWLNFYIYICLPGTVISYLLILLNIKNTIGIIINIFLIIISCFVFVGLYKHRLWGWKLNYLLLISIALLIPFIEVILSTNILTKAFPITSYSGALIRYGLFWLLPNHIYFKKRYGLFK